MDMVCFNILYEGDKEDVDIICVPNSVAEKITILTQMFLDWLPNAEDEIYWETINGRKVSVCETDGFIKWLNTNYSDDIPKSYVVTRHSKLCDEYDVIEF